MKAVMSKQDLTLCNWQKGLPDWEGKRNLLFVRKMKLNFTNVQTASENLPYDFSPH